MSRRVDQFDDSILPIGKLPAPLLGSLIHHFAVSDESVIVGPGVGRDAAVVELEGTLLVLKSDPVTIASSQAAKYLVNVNANDLACLGATPRWMLVTSLLPEGKTTESTVTALFESLQHECEAHGIVLAGGHTEITAGLDRPILVGMLIGVSSPERLVRPGQGKPGDRLLLTRPISIEGTALLATERADVLAEALGKELVTDAARLLETPGISITRHAQALIDSGGVTALHDPTEGGLAMGLRELGEASGCGVLVDRKLIPVMDSTLAIAAWFDIDPLGMLASGSLLAAVKPEALDDAFQACRKVEASCAVIGKLTPPEHGFTLLTDGVPMEFPAFDTDEVSRALSGTVDP